MTMTIRLSEVLAPIDRRALRRIAAASGKLYASQDVDAVSDEWTAALLDAMMSAHMAALREYAPFVAAFGDLYTRIICRQSLCSIRFAVFSRLLIIAQFEL